MAGKRFPFDYADDEKTTLASGDKLFIYDAEAGKPGIVDADNLGAAAGSSPLTKDGYEWRKNAGNPTNEYQQGETIEGVGTIWPGYYIKAYFKSTPGADDPKNHTLILFSAEL